jgi:tetratricopeptide (TPR) repeat protein
MYVTRAMGDAEGESYWLEQRRSVANESGDRVSDLVRHAIGMPAEEEVARATLLEEAHRARPEDYTLRELFEQATGGGQETAESNVERARWLMEQASKGAGDAAPMALEAAFSYELAGDLEQAAECVDTAVRGNDRLAPVFAQRYALAGHGGDEVIQALGEQLRRAGEPDERRDVRMLIGRIELARGHWSQAIEAFRAVVEEAPGDLPALHALESLLIVQGDHQALDEIAMGVARATEGATALAHSALVTRLRYAAGRWDDAHEAVSIAFAQKPPSVWAMRHMSAHARERKEWETVAFIDRELADQSESPIEKATLLVRASEATMAAGDDQTAAELLGAALEQWPRHPVALLERATLLERAGSANEAAEAFEELSLVCQSPRYKAAQLYRAATLWMSLGDAIGRAEGRRLLEAVVEVDPTYEDAFQRLQEIYLAAGAKRELAELLAARLERVTEPEERLRLEIVRGKMLAEAGSAAEARVALSAALEAEPDNADALLAYADVCAAEEDWAEVEQSLVRVGRLVSTADKQVPIYLRLGNLYDKHLPNLERAEQAYQQVLKLQPDNVTAGDKLVDLALRMGRVDQAFEQQHALIEAAKSAQEKCERTVRLAELQQAADRMKEAEQTLLKARRAWPRETSPTAALYHFYKRTGQIAGADALLERAQTEVRRGLAAGRFEPQLFSMAAMVAEIREQHDAAEVARATLAAIEGEPAIIEGAGVLAAQPDLDEHLAPEVFTPPFRSLLSATGALMDYAVPFDLASLRARPLPPNHAEVLERTRELAAGYGLPDVQVLASTALSETCVPACAEPPTLCFGLSLVAHERADVREFLIHRALKILQTKTAALSRTAPIDLWPLLAAYLKIHSPSFNPPGVDVGRLGTFLASMQAIAPPAMNPQINLLASEVIGAIGNRASTLNTMANTWGSRAALLAMGDLNIALQAIAFAHGVPEGAPASGPERIRWISRHAEAREIIAFSVSDGYAKARVGLGVASLEMIEAIPLDE